MVDVPALGWFFEHELVGRLLRIGRFLGTAVGVGSLGVAAFFLIGPERIWSEVAGPADQGPADLEHLERRPSGNDALACTPEGCSPRMGAVDVPLPIYSQSPPQLLNRLDRLVLAGRDVERVDDRTDPTYRRYVARTRLMRFPDTIDARAQTVDQAGTALLLYSRSLLGRGDMGANAARLREWASRLSGASGS